MRIVVPDCVFIAPGAVAPGLGVELVGTGIVLDQVPGRAFLDLDALVAAGRYGVPVDPVSITSVLPVPPLRPVRVGSDMKRTRYGGNRRNGRICMRK